MHDQSFRSLFIGSVTRLSVVPTEKWELTAFLFSQKIKKKKKISLATVAYLRGQKWLHFSDKQFIFFPGPIMSNIHLNASANSSLGRRSHFHKVNKICSLGFLHFWCALFFYYFPCQKSCFLFFFYLTLSFKSFAVTLFFFCCIFWSSI